MENRRWLLKAPDIFWKAPEISQKTPKRSARKKIKLKILMNRNVLLLIHLDFRG